MEIIIISIIIRIIKIIWEMEYITIINIDLVEFIVVVILKNIQKKIIIKKVIW